MTSNLTKLLIAGTVALTLNAATPTDVSAQLNPSKPENYRFYLFPGEKDISCLVKREVTVTDNHDKRVKRTIYDSLYRHLETINGKLFEPVKIYGENRREFGDGADYTLVINNPRNGEQNLIDFVYEHRVKSVVPDGQDIMSKADFYKFFLGSEADTSRFYPTTIPFDDDTISGALYKALSPDAYQNLLDEITIDARNSLDKQMFNNRQTGGVSGKSYEHRQLRPGYGSSNNQENYPTHPNVNINVNIRARGGNRNR